MLALRVAAYSSSKPALGGAQARLCFRPEQGTRPSARSFEGKAGTARPCGRPLKSSTPPARVWTALYRAVKRTRRKGRKPKPTSTMHVHTVVRSEEHTSELQSPCNLVCRL